MERKRSKVSKPLDFQPLLVFFFMTNDSFRSGQFRFYAGYHEEVCLSLYVNVFASMSYFGRVVSNTVGQNWENTGPLILGFGNYRYADYALTCPLLIMDLLFCLRAPFKISFALCIHVVLMCGVMANFYTGHNWERGHGPAVAWFFFSSFWYCIAFVGLVIVIKSQYSKLARLAEGSDAKKALLPLRVAIITILTLWIVYPIIWVLGDQGVGLIAFSGVECIHAFCDIVAKSVYGFTLARFKSYYDRKLCQILDLCGEEVEKEFAEIDRRLSSTFKPRKLSRDIEKDKFEELELRVQRAVQTFLMRRSSDSLNEAAGGGGIVAETKGPGDRVVVDLANFSSVTADLVRSRDEVVQGSDEPAAAELSTASGSFDIPSYPPSVRGWLQPPSVPPPSY